MGGKHMQKYFEKWDASTFAFPTAGTGDLIGLSSWRGSWDVTC